jgi:hypothetical protein
MVVVGYIGYRYFQRKHPVWMEKREELKKEKKRKETRKRMEERGWQVINGRKKF